MSRGTVLIVAVVAAAAGAYWVKWRGAEKERRAQLAKAVTAVRVAWRMRRAMVCVAVAVFALGWAWLHEHGHTHRLDSLSLAHHGHCP